MWHSIKIYLLIVPIFLIIDFIWLGRVMVNFYKSELGTLARRSGESLTPVWWAAIAVYLVIPLGIVLFALPRVSNQALFLSSVLWGFVFGAVLYGVYDLTNYALVDRWPWRMTVVDILWGGTICAVVTYMAALLDRWLS